MARISVEQKALTDARFTQLGLAICPKPEIGAQGGFYLHALGLGAMVFVWNTCQERGRHSLHWWELDALAMQLGILGRGDFAKALTFCDLGEWTSDEQNEIRIKGTEGRIEWLEKRREDGKTGGRPRKTLGFRENGLGS